jgi:hypothetical protein
MEHLVGMTPERAKAGVYYISDVYSVDILTHICYHCDTENDALIVAKPGNSILLEAINHIVVNVKNRYYGNSCLEPTGPLLLAKLFSRQQKQTLDMKHMFYISMKYRFILFNNYSCFFYTTKI